MEERLKNPDNRIVDVHIVYAKTKWQSKRIQKKMLKMGFSYNLNHIKIINSWECYFVAQMVHSNDEYNGNKFISHGSDKEILSSKVFEKSLISYRNFMKI